MTIASVGDITLAPAVIPTRPASIPFSKRLKSSVFVIRKLVIRALIAPAAAARLVVTNTLDTCSGSADNTEPPLNPNYPNHKRNTPIVARGIL